MGYGVPKGLQVPRMFTLTGKSVFVLEVRYLRAKSRFLLPPVGRAKSQFVLPLVGSPIHTGHFSRTFYFRKMLA